MLEQTQIRIELSQRNQELVAVREQILSMTNFTKKYKLDTGQAIQEVERYDIKDLYNRETWLINRIAELENMLNRCGNDGSSFYVF